MCEFNPFLAVLPLCLVFFGFLFLLIKYDSPNPVDWMAQFVENRKYEKTQKDKRSELYRLYMNNSRTIEYLVDNKHEIQMLINTFGRRPHDIQNDIILLQQRIAKLEEQLESKRGRK